MNNLSNTFRPRQNIRHFADDIFKCILLNENVWITIKNSLKFVPEGPINNIPALVQIMAWRRPVASFTKEVNWRLAKRPLKTNGRLANRQSIFVSKRGHWRQAIIWTNDVKIADADMRHSASVS